MMFVLMTRSMRFFCFYVAVCAGDLICERFTNCRGQSTIAPSLSWNDFTSSYNSAGSIEDLSNLQKTFGSSAALVRECRMGLAAVWYRMGSHWLSTSNFQQAHNAHQMAMAMFWDVAREEGGLDCLQTQPLWDLDWNAFMTQYLQFAFQLKRHEDTGLPVAEEIRGYRDHSLKIGIASVCAYDASNKLHGIDVISLKNRKQYVAKHQGYVNVFSTVNEAAPRHPVWSAIALPLKMLKSGNYDYVMWMDCDALFIDTDRTIEDMIFRDPGGEFFISEDGRGLSGGNWIAKKSPWSIELLERVYNDPVFDQYDLKDQVSLLWNVLRPSVSMTQEEHLQSHGGLGYPNQIRLIPQRLINAYPWSLCRPSHHCFEDGVDFIVSFITLSSLSRDMAFALLEGFAHRVPDDLLEM